jgi:hypothetical protein
MGVRQWILVARSKWETRWICVPSSIQSRSLASATRGTFHSYARQRAATSSVNAMSILRGLGDEVSNEEAGAMLNPLQRELSSQECSGPGKISGDGEPGGAFAMARAEEPATC